MRTAVRTYLRAKFTSFRNSPDAMLRDLHVPITHTMNTHPFGLLHATSSPLWEQPSWSRCSQPLPSPKRESPSLRDARTVETLFLIPINTTHLPLRETSCDSGSPPIALFVASVEKKRFSHLQFDLMESTGIASRVYRNAIYTITRRLGDGSDGVDQAMRPSKRLKSWHVFDKNAIGKAEESNEF